MKNKLKRNSMIIALGFAVLSALLYWFGRFDTFEQKSLDHRFKIRGTVEPKSPVVIAAIDEAALKRIGKFPWRRSVHAKLVDAFRRAGAASVVFDVLFYEPDSDHPGDDRALAEAIKKNGKVVSAYSFDYIEEQVPETDKEGQSTLETKAFVEKGESLPSIVKASKMMGFVNCFPDSDGYLRRAPLTYKFEDQEYSALNIQAVAVAKGVSVEEILKTLPVSDAVSWGDATKEVLINYRGDVQGTFKTYSCADILDGSIPPEWLKGKIVLIGSTALGLYDHYPTPFSASFPGLYFHANVIDNIWANDFLVPAGSILTIILILIFGVLMGWMVPQTSAWKGGTLVFLGVAAFWGLTYVLMVERLYYIEFVPPAVSLVLSYTFAFFYRFIVEQKEKAGIKKAFGVYVNPHVVDQISKNPDGLKLGGEMREMTVMFSDVAGFTSISEKLTPEELVHLLNLYLTAMTDTIMKYDGTVDKYEGDAIMAFWGAPLVQPDHAKQACLAVLENRQRLAELNAELSKKGLQSLAARCGINSGPMNVGNMGSNQKFNYTVMGDAVNLASRLEGANKQYGTYLMISEATFTQAADAVEARELDLLRVKGKKLPIKVLELVAKKGELSDDQKRGFEKYTEALELYRHRKFKEALKNFEKVLEFLKDDGPSMTYIERSKSYIETPPSRDWDGVFTMTTK